MSYDQNHYTDCCHEGCYATICLAPKSYERLRRTGESFYCPAGHGQHFTGKTEEQKKIDRLTWHLRRSAAAHATVHRHRELLIDVLRHCPMCGATPGRYVRVYREYPEEGIATVREWLAEHLREEHGAAVALEAAAE